VGCEPWVLVPLVLVAVKFVQKELSSYIVPSLALDMSVLDVLDMSVLGALDMSVLGHISVLGLERV